MTEIADAPAQIDLSSKKGRPLYWTAERTAELRPQVRRWMRDTSARDLYFGIKGMTAEFRISDDVARRFVTEVEEEGLVAYSGASHIGWSWKGATGQAVTLGTLLRVALAHVDQEATAEKGRRGQAVERLTPSQYKDIKTVANLIARHAGEGDAEKVTGRWFGFDDEAKAWTLEAQVARWSDEDHRASFARKAAGGVWHARLNTGRSKMVGAVANLLDLAATQQIIPRIAADGAGRRYAAPEWKPIIKRWTARLVAANPDASAALLANGFRALTLQATRRRERSFGTTNWLAVRAEIEERYEALSADPNAAVQDVRYARQQRDAARYVWRLVVSFLSDALGRPIGPSRRVRLRLGKETHWATAQDNRRSLVPDGAIRAAATAATGKTRFKKKLGGAKAEFDYKTTWTSRAGEFAQSFVEGERGIAGFVTWSTAPVDWLERHHYPARAFINPSREMLRGIRRATGSDKQPYLLGCETLVGRLRMFSQLAGWAHEHGDLLEEAGHRRYDFVSSDDLASLCNLELVLAYSEWVREELDDDEGEADTAVPHVVADLAKHLSKVASPYLEGRALRRAAALEKDGMCEDAEKARTEAQRLRDEGERLKAWGYEHGRRQNTRKDIVAIAEGWAGSNHRNGWLKLMDLVSILLKKAEAESGLTMRQQLESMRAAETATPRQRAALLAWQTHAWAALMRSAMLVNLVRKIPLRARALAELRLDWWEATVDGRRVVAWHRDASIMLRIPGWGMKTKNREYYAPYIRPECVGQPDFEAGAQRDLLEAFMRPHGARDFMLTRWETVDVRRAEGRTQEPPVALDVVTSPYVLPGSATFGHGGHGRTQQMRLQTGLRWTPSSLSVHFESLVREHAEELQINVVALQGMQGAFRIHVARLLYGTHWAPKNLIDASLMLHHADIALTSRLYVGRSSAQSTLEATGAERAGARGGKDEGEIVVFLKQALQATEARAVAAEQRVAEHAAQLSELTAMVAQLTQSVGHSAAG